MLSTESWNDCKVLPQVPQVYNWSGRGLQVVLLALTAPAMEQSILD